MIDVYYCASGNKKFARIAIDHDMRYGAQLPHTVYFPPEFVDQDWKKPNREAYITQVAKHKPHMASVLDLERPDQVEEVLGWAEDVAAHVEVVMIIPKYKDAIRDIPLVIGGKPVRLGYSVPTEYGGSAVPLHLFHDWPVHLLGGGPTVQLELSYHLNVASVDGNSMQRNCKAGCVFNGHNWMSLTNYLEYRYASKEMPYMAFDISCKNVMSMWKLRYAKGRR